MTDNLLEASLGTAPDPQKDQPAPTPVGSSAGGTRPSGLPDKFWDEKKGQVRVDALIKSYLELERKLGSAAPVRDVPTGPDEYKVEVKHELLNVDPDVNKALHAAGFTQQQVQLVYDLAGDRMMPLIAELASIFEAEHQVERLTTHFGGQDRWREIARQIDAWGRSRLPERVFEALATTFEGVVAMHRMMTGEEPGLLREGSDGERTPNETELKQMMRDPRYWRHQDPVMVEKVRDGFRRLYHEKG